MTFGDLFARLLRLGSAGQTRIRTGTATPEGTVTGAIGDLFLRTDGGAGTTLYSKTSGSGNTGWTAVGGAAAGTVTTTGSPANGNLTKFSGAASVTNADLTGDVTTSGGVAATIAAAAVTLAKMANLATDRLIGRDTAGTGVPEALTVGGGVEFTGSGGIQTSAFTGDVTKSAGGTVQTIANDAVTFAKMQNVSAATRVLGRGTSAGAGDVEEMSFGAGISVAGTVINSVVTGSNGGDVVGPVSSVDDRIVTFDSTTGKLLQDGGQTIAQVIAAAAGTVVQVAHTQTGAVSTGTTTIPMDDTIPQNTEGNEVMTLAITPTDAGNELLIEVIAIIGNSAGSRFQSAALFQDATADALAATSEYQGAAGGFNNLVIRHVMTAGTTSATTFKVRAGSDAAGTMTFNGIGGARKYGGVMASSITITEIVP